MTAADPDVAVIDVDQIRHFAHKCAGVLERFGLDLVCNRCGERFLNAYGRFPCRATVARPLNPDDRAQVCALAQHLTRERRQREQPLIPREYLGGTA